MRFDGTGSDGLPCTAENSVFCIRYFKKVCFLNFFCLAVRVLSKYIQCSSLSIKFEKQIKIWTKNQSWPEVQADLDFKGDRVYVTYFFNCHKISPRKAF